MQNLTENIPLDRGFSPKQVPGASFHRAGTIRDPHRCHQLGEKTPLVGTADRKSLCRETNSGEAQTAGKHRRAGPEERGGSAPSRPAGPRRSSPPLPGAAVMSWHREEPLAPGLLSKWPWLVSFPPPCPGAAWGLGGVEIGVIPPPGLPRFNPRFYTAPPALGTSLSSPPEQGWFSPGEPQGFGQAGVKPGGTVPAPIRSHRTCPGALGQPRPHRVLWKCPTAPLLGSCPGPSRFLLSPEL